MVNVGFEIVYLVKLAKTEERGRCEFTASDSSRETAQMEGYSAGQINVVKGCVNQNRAHATFEHVFLASRVEIEIFALFIMVCLVLLPEPYHVSSSIQIRTVGVYLCTNQYFDYVVMLTIGVNCIFLAMTKPIEEAE